MSFSLAPYQKTVAAVVSYALVWGAVVVASVPKAITAAEWLQLAGGIAVATGVYQAVNTPTPKA